MKAKTIATLAVLFGMSAHGASSLHNPNFIRQLQNPDTYTKPVIGSESICGVSDLQHVEDYNGSKVTVDFVKQMEPSVAALAYGTVPNTSKYCTGTLISEDLFITAAHCIDSGILQEFAVFNYQKKKGSTDLQEQDHVKVIEVVEKGQNSLDYAIIRLDGKPGLKYGFKKVRVTPVGDGEGIVIVQHPSGNPKMVDSGHKNGERGTYITYGDLDTEPGSSGSGVVDATGNVIAIHTNGGCYSSGGANAGVPMTEIVKVSTVIQNLIKN